MVHAGWALRIPLGLALLLPCAAQIADLATNDDGRDVLFSGYYRLPGAPEGPEYQTTVFRYHKGAWSAVAYSEGSATVSAPRITGDGKIVAWHRYDGCGFCRLLAPHSSAEFSGLDPGTLKIPSYSIELSRNGRYAFFPGFWGLIPPAVQDLASGQVLEGVPPGGSRIADDGTVLGFKTQGVSYPFLAFTNPPTVVRWRPGKAPEDMFSAPRITGITLAAGGRHAIVETPAADRHQLWLLDVETRQNRLIGEVLVDKGAPADLPAWVSLSADGRRAVFLWWNGTPGYRSTVYFWDESAGAVGSLKGIPEGATGAVISHDGAVAWVATSSNRLLRFDLSQDSSEEVLPAFSFRLRFDRGGLVPGSAVTFTGGGPLPGEHVRMGDLEFPIVGVDDVDVTAIQLPWELASMLPASGYGELQLTAGKDGYPFVLKLDLAATNEIRMQFEYAGRAESYPPNLRIDSAHPARSGEKTRVWLTGLGPLDRPVATGAPGPVDDPPRPLTTVACAIMGRDYLNPPWQGVAVSPVTYAPGRVGFYQLEVTIPAGWPEGIHNLQCYRPGTQDSANGLIHVSGR